MIIIYKKNFDALFHFSAVVKAKTFSKCSQRKKNAWNFNQRRMNKTKNGGHGGSAIKNVSGEMDTTLEQVPSSVVNKK